MNIGIVGLGVVGSAIKAGFEKIGHNVKEHDIKLYTRIEDILNTEICYICVPTNSNEDGACDVSIVHEVVNDLDKLDYKGIVAIKSTVEPGTTEKFRDETNLTICFVPEFLRERCAEDDFINHNSLLLVGTDSDEVYKKVKDSHGSLPVHKIKSSIIESELVKYFSNTYKAMRVIFANTFYKICGELGANYDVVKDAFLLHGIFEGHYLNVNKDFGGFGGVCLPKDTKAMSYLVEKLDLDLQLFKMIIEENDKFVIKVPKGMRKEI